MVESTVQGDLPGRFTESLAEERRTVRRDVPRRSEALKKRSEVAARCDLAVADGRFHRERVAGDLSSEASWLFGYMTHYEAEPVNHSLREVVCGAGRLLAILCFCLAAMGVPSFTT